MAVIRKSNSQKTYYQVVIKTTTKTTFLMTDWGLLVPQKDGAARAVPNAFELCPVVTDEDKVKERK